MGRRADYVIRISCLNYRGYDEWAIRVVEYGFGILDCVTLCSGDRVGTGGEGVGCLAAGSVSLSGNTVN